ncbi:MAG: hydrogen peroxide-inducible genes activator [Xanthomonadales bacterium]|nr:hydrogen peroxide-inducible genes activator [Xanthomonadales bacterium]
MINYPMTQVPTLKQLKYLCAVAEQQHFGRAAEACFVSQSTLSAAILELEDILGVALLERDNKRVRLTAVGKDITARARQILTATNDLVAAACAAHAPFSTEMRLGVIPTIAPFVLPVVLKHIRKTYPDFKLFIREDLSAHLIQALHAGELDVLLLALPYPGERLVTEHLFYDDLVVAYEKRYRLHDEDRLLVKDLKNKELLLLEDGHCLRDHAMDACKISTADVRIPYQATSLNTIIQMVANRIGITILPQMAVDAKMLRGTNVITRPFDEDNIRRSIGLMWRHKSPRQEEFQQLGQLICHALGYDD